MSTAIENVPSERQVVMRLNKVREDNGGRAFSRHDMRRIAAQSNCKGKMARVLFYLRWINTYEVAVHMLKEMGSTVDESDELYNADPDNKQADKGPEHYLTWLTDLYEREDDDE